MDSNYDSIKFAICITVLLITDNEYANDNN